MNVKVTDSASSSNVMCAGSVTASPMGRRDDHLMAAVAVMGAMATEGNVIGRGTCPPFPSAEPAHGGNADAVRRKVQIEAEVWFWRDPRKRANHPRREFVVTGATRTVGNNKGRVWVEPPVVAMGAAMAMTVDGIKQGEGEKMYQSEVW